MRVAAPGGVTKTSTRSPGASSPPTAPAGWTGTATARSPSGTASPLAAAAPERDGRSIRASSGSPEASGQAT